PKSWPLAELAKHPIRRRSLGGRPASRRFSYPRPILLLPAHDGFFVALEGASFGFLRARVQAMHQPTNMIAMVMHPEFPPDEFGDSGRGPQLRPVTVRLRPLDQQLHQAAPLARVQFPRASRREAHAQSIGPPATACAEPAQN